MFVKIFSNSDEIASAVSEIIIAQIREDPFSSLCFATGSSPIKTYEKLIQAYSEGRISFKNVTTFNLDEYCLKDKFSKDSYRFFMQEKLFGKIDIEEKNINFLDGTAADHQSECDAFSRKIKDIGIDIQLLGIGRNGHIGFNEPDDHFSDGAHFVSLTQSTISANSRFFESSDDVPTAALTMGIGDIMQAKQILLIAAGEEKADAIKATVEGEITPLCPASILQKHKNTTLFLDRHSASKLSKNYF